MRHSAAETLETTRLVEDSAWSVPAALRELGIAWSPAGRPGPGRGRVRPVIVCMVSCRPLLSRRAMQRRYSSTT